MFDFIFGSDEEEEVNPKEQAAIDYYKKYGKIPKNKQGGWYINYIPSSLGSVDRQHWMMLSDGQLQVKK